MNKNGLRKYGSLAMTFLCFSHEVRHLMISRVYSSPFETSWTIARLFLWKLAHFTLFQTVKSCGVLCG